jgi:predicted alpha/beta hydrolase family esterase
MSEVIGVANCDKPVRIGDVVFVHGLDGDPRTTWQVKNDSGTYWPKWLGEDLPNIGIWSLGFEAASSDWNGTTMAVVDRATNLLAQLQSAGLGDRPIVFVAHSLGGLVVKQMLRHGQDYGNSGWKRIATNTVGVVFLATPHAGSSLATIVKFFRLYRSSASVNDLSANDPHLRDLNIWYRNNVVNLDVETLVFQETIKPRGVLVVPPNTSDPGLQAVIPIPVDADHIEICKPLSRESLVYRGTKEFIQHRLSATAIGHAAIALSTDDYFVDIDISNTYPPIRYLEYEEIDDEEHQRNVDEAILGPDMTLRYELQRESERLVITPRMPYLDAVARGGPVYHVKYTWSPFGWQFPNLDFKIVNNSARTICLTEAVLEIASSKSDTTPMPVIPARSFSMKFWVDNEGWGPLQDATLDLNLFPTDHDEDFDSPFIHHLDLGTIDEQCEVELARQFASIGVQVEFPEDSNRLPFVKKDGLGPFTNGYAILCGVLSYKYVGIDGEKHDAAVKIGTYVCLLPPPLGLYTPPSYQYDAIFDTDRTNYQVRVPLSQSLRSGEADRFNIRIAAAKSSVHDFHVHLICNGEQLPESKPITLRLLLPRSQADKIRLASND